MHCAGLVAPTGRAPARPFQSGRLRCTEARVCRPYVSSLLQFKNHGRHGHVKGQNDGISAASAEGNTHTNSAPAGPVENLVIVGSGPAGYTAAIYAARANLRPLMFEGYQAGGSPGGQLMTTSEVENFPGFPDGVSGPELMDLMRRQAARWGTRFLTEDVERIDFASRGSDGDASAPLQVQGTDTVLSAHALVVATGATARRLGLPSEAQYWSRGISACAICDGASPLFRGQEVVVVGGGDTALEEALYLLKYATRVHLLVRGDTMRASMAMQQRVLRAPRVSVRFQTLVVDAEGDGTILTGVQVRDTTTGKIETIPARGLFYGIGHEPNSGLLRGAAELDSAGYVVPAGPGGATTVPGVFVAGDLQDKEWRQAVTAAGSGCAAALAAERWLAAGDLLHAPEQAVSAGARVEEEEEVVDHDSERKGVSTAYHARDEKEYEFDARETLHRGQYALRKLYHESPLLLAVLYTAPSCAPCRTVKPILRKLVSEYHGKMHLVEIDIEEDPEIAQGAGVTSTPTLQFFKNKKRVLHSPGVKMKREYRNLIESNL